jgi:hypothetical protein
MLLTQAVFGDLMGEWLFVSVCVCLCVCVCEENEEEMVTNKNVTTL